MAVAAERAPVERAFKGEDEPTEIEAMPTFEEWFNGRFWREWVVGRKNKPSEAAAKKNVFDNHLQKPFGTLRLNHIGVAEVAEFRASLVEKKLQEKTIENILGVLSKPLRYAV